jgi:hypothetical protein
MEKEKIMETIGQMSFLLGKFSANLFKVQETIRILIDELEKFEKELEKK